MINGSMLEIMGSQICSLITLDFVHVPVLRKI